jgi:very-short-patch-repair endonuclease
MPTGIYQRRPMSPATKEKIGAAHRGKVHTAQARENMSAAHAGKSSGPHSAATRALLSVLLTGKKRTPEQKAAQSARMKGRRPSADMLAAAIAATKGKRRPRFSDEWRRKISAAGIGREVSLETRRKKSESAKRAWEQGLWDVRIPQRYTSLAQSLHRTLSATGLTLEPEVRFGRFTVDLYDRENHVAYEADGQFWHDKTERSRPGYHAERDAYLQSVFGLRVVHFTDKEIALLARKAS